MTWVTIAVGVGGALVTGVGAYAGSKKQAGAAKDASNLNMDVFRTINAQQQPFIQSGYGALSKLNTLLGLSPRPGMGGGGAGGQGGPMMSPPLTMPSYRPTPGGGVQQIVSPMGGDRRMYAGGPGGDPSMGSTSLSRILALRAAHGDTQAARILGMQP